jgi:hypothetical protein
LINQLVSTGKWNDGEHHVMIYGRDAMVIFPTDETTSDARVGVTWDASAIVRLNVAIVNPNDPDAIMEDTGAHLTTIFVNFITSKELSTLQPENYVTDRITPGPGKETVFQLWSGDILISRTVTARARSTYRYWAIISFAADREDISNSLSSIWYVDVVEVMLKGPKSGPKIIEVKGGILTKELDFFWSWIPTDEQTHVFLRVAFDKFVISHKKFRFVRESCNYLQQPFRDLRSWAQKDEDFQDDLRAQVSCMCMLHD